MTSQTREVLSGVSLAVGVLELYGPKRQDIQVIERYTPGEFYPEAELRAGQICARFGRSPWVGDVAIAWDIPAARYPVSPDPTDPRAD